MYEEEINDKADLYGEEHLEELTEEDEITPEEAGFMKGYIES